MKVLLTLLTCVFLATVLNLAWLFGVALPHGPASIQPSALPKNPTIDQSDRYETALDLAAVRHNERDFARTSAIGLEILFILVAGAITWTIHLTQSTMIHAERLDDKSQPTENRKAR